ncbi:FtsK/SpoIIIE domain-containing protein [Fictibacillus iocasae]|uniref:FtsK/SpoIIIE domain-containing protein n=1 Tax=Fictibacillus iocasae TaxID=2715437 RepID=A0ABW2NJR1_9BACL
MISTRETVTNNEFIAKWIKKIFINHFKEQRKAHTEKIFIKISGFTELQVNNILKELKNSTSELVNYYNPKIRTITPIEGFSEFSFKENETSTWLRNNTGYNEALILIINEITPEAQSLENVYSIDESYLISQEGLKLLYSTLSLDYGFAAEEIEDIKTFLSIYNKVNEPQLLDLVNFIVNIITDEAPSTVQKIQKHLPELNLFKDTNLTIRATSLPRIKNNFYLSNLQSASSSLETEKLLDKLYSFIQAEENNEQLLVEINKQEFEKDAIDFLNHKSKKLLNYEFELIDYVLKFKDKRKNLVEKVKDAFSIEELNEEEKKNAEQMIKALEDKDDPDLIQEFADEFSAILDKTPGLLKSITRVIDKLRHPSEYEDFSHALLYEVFNLIEENMDVIEGNVSFTIKLLTNKISNRTKKLIEVYFGNIHNVIPNVKFEDNSIILETDETSKDNEITIAIKLYHEGKFVKENKLKLLNIFDNNLYQMLQIVEEGNIPYIKNYLENEIEVLDTTDFLTKNVDYYIAENNEEMQSAINNLNDFTEYYLGTLKEVNKNGLFSIQVNVLEEQIRNFSSNIYQSVLVSKDIYRALNIMGTIDTLNCKKGETDYAQERIVTLLNPIRLLSYLQRFKKINEQIQWWALKAKNNELETLKLNEYLEYEIEQTMNLAPRYFTSDGDESFLIEVSERMGEGRFTLNTSPVKNQDHLAKEFSDELLKVTKNYLEVYPYAKDGLDLLFLYCQSADIIIKSIDVLFKDLKDLNKLKICVHSTQAAVLHQKLNKWVAQREEFIKPIGQSKFPLVELKVISGDKVSEISSHIKNHMIDADLVVLTDYFGNSNQIKFDFEKIKTVNSNDWFVRPFKEPLLNKEAVKRIPFVSEHLPQVLQNFYQLQFIIQSNQMPDQNELYVLKNKIAITSSSDNTLIDFMHDNFNWIMIMDRFLDKSLLRKASSKAQIIQYKSKTGANKNYKLILSSSQYVRKLSSNLDDYAYYDRLTRKLKEIMKNEDILKVKIKESVDIVKDISGALVLKVIGPGKYAHEMMATYLSIKNNNYSDSGLSVWSICDELPWFTHNKRRPDLVQTTITVNKLNKVDITFELKELKFINHRIFDRERADSIKQIQAGRQLYENIFDFSKMKTDAAYWKDELLHYFIEKGSYSNEEADILTTLQSTDLKDINVEFKASVDVYCYTSNLSEYHFEKIQDGQFREVETEFITNLFNRYYILKELGAHETQLPSYEELNGSGSLEEQIKNEDIIIELPPKIPPTVIKGKDEIDHNGEDTSDENKTENDKKTDKRDSDDPEFINIEPKDTISVVDPIIDNALYPELEALKGLANNTPLEQSDYTDIKNNYQNLLIRNFNKNGISIRVKEIIVGSSVIRMVISIPSDVSAKKITARGNDIQLWLGLNNEPHIFINSKGINIDIVREDPETIFFENFMNLTRKQLQNKIKESNLIAPLGLDPLNNVIYIDLSDSTTPHLLTGGTTGSGKSVTLNSVILGIMCLYSPSNVEFIFIDPKKVEFAVYENKKHTRSVITEINEAVIALDSLVNEMEERYGKFAKVGATNLEEYIEITETSIPRLVVVFDEFADFMSQEKEIAKRVENAILRLGQKARAAGVHLIICTQNPKADIINTNIRNNLGARLALRVADANASQVILDSDGAERLAGKGDFLAKVSYGNTERGKSPFLTPKVKAALLRFFEN